MKKFAADTSFLFSLYGKDGWTEKARGVSQSLDKPILITVFSSLELTNAALHAEFAGHLEIGLGSVIVSRFEAEKEAGRLVYPPFSPGKAVRPRYQSQPPPYACPRSSHLRCPACRCRHRARSH